MTSSSFPSRFLSANSGIARSLKLTGIHSSLNSNSQSLRHALRALYSSHTLCPRIESLEFQFCSELPNHQNGNANVNDNQNERKPKKQNESENGSASENGNDNNDNDNNSNKLDLIDDDLNVCYLDFGTKDEALSVFNVIRSSDPRSLSSIFADTSLKAMNKHNHIPLVEFCLRKTSKYVSFGNLSKNVSYSSLRMFFEKFGPIEKYSLHPESQSCLLIFREQGDAIEAVKEMLKPIKADLKKDLKDDRVALIGNGNHSVSEGFSADFWSQSRVQREEGVKFCIFIT